VVFNPKVVPVQIEFQHIFTTFRVYVMQQKDINQFNILEKISRKENKKRQRHPSVGCLFPSHTTGGQHP
jgi:hypothetical protein